MSRPITVEAVLPICLNKLNLSLCRQLARFHRCTLPLPKWGSFHNLVQRSIYWAHKASTQPPTTYHHNARTNITGVKSVWERERERERETDRQTDRQRQRETVRDRETERDSQRQGQREKERYRDKERGGNRDRQTHTRERHTQIQRGTETDIDTERRADRRPQQHPKGQTHGKNVDDFWKGSVTYPPPMG